MTNRRFNWGIIGPGRIAHQVHTDRVYPVGRHLGRYFVPANATVVVTGAFRREPTLALLRGFRYTDWDATVSGVPLAGDVGPYSTIVWPSSSSTNLFIMFIMVVNSFRLILFLLDLF